MTTASTAANQDPALTAAIATANQDPALTAAIATAIEHLPIERSVRRTPVGYIVVVKDDGRYACYSADAWTAPTEQPLLPWHPPTGTPVVRVHPDGTVTHQPTPASA